MFDSKPILGAGESPFYGYEIPYSCRFNDDDSAQMTWTPGGAGTEETWTFATWFKRCNLSSIMQLFNAAAGNEIQFTAANKIQFTTASGTLLTTQVFRDVGSWMHLCLSVDTTQATAANRVKLYINGAQVTVFDTETYPDQNEVTEFSKAAAHTIAANEVDTEEFDGYLAETVYSDGTQEEVTAYGQFKYGIWIPKTFSGTYGTYGWHLDYAVAPGTGNGAGTDVSGNVEHWTDAGLAADDQVLDSPTNNYATLNTVWPTANVTHSNGNLQLTTSSNWYSGRSTQALKGKVYFEIIRNATDNFGFGIGTPDAANYLIGNDVYGWGFDIDNVNDYKRHAGSSSSGYGRYPYGSGEIFRCAVDKDAGKIWFGDEDGWFDGSDPAAGTDPAYADSDITNNDIFVMLETANGEDVVINFGQLGFTYTPPFGFKALCSENLPEPTIPKSDNGFDVVLYEGTGAEKAITDLEFQPDLVWIKNRDTGDEHVLTDSVRGATKELNSDSTAIESTVAQGLKSFDAVGFTLGTDDRYNTNGENFVAWCFRMGANYGFDIQTYEGTGVAHAESHDLAVLVG